MEKTIFENSFSKLTLIFRDIEKIRDGISEKVSFFLLQLMSVFISLAVALYYGWKLTMVVISYVPVALITNSIIEKVSENHFKQSNQPNIHTMRADFCFFIIFHI